MVLHLAVYWLVRAVGMEVKTTTQAAIAFVITFPANLIGTVLYISALKRLMKISSKKVASTTYNKTYTATLAELRYSYFNTNPVYVLMCDLLSTWENSDSNKRLSTTIWYEAGKAHLQAPDPKAEA